MTKSRLHALVLLFVLAWSQFPGAAFGGEVNLPDTGFNVKVMSLKEMREARVVHQNYDFSCGSAAVATLLTFTYDMPTTEEDAFKDMWAVGDQEHIRQVGFSLADMQKYLTSRGLNSAGYKVSLERLRRMRVPAIVLVHPHGYNHFVVFRGWKNNGAIVADPRLGVRRIPAADFMEMWNGVVFIISDYKSLAESRFNDEQDLRVITRATSTAGMAYGRQGVGDFLIDIPTFNEY